MELLCTEIPALSTQLPRRLLPMKFDFQHSTMTPVLPLEIIGLIIDIVGENEDTNLLKELALVSHYFLQICSKHLFATVELHDASSKKGFVKLLKSRPDVVKYIRELTYIVGFKINEDDHLLSPILSNFLPTVSRLNCLTINASSHPDWNTLNSSLISAFFHLMRLPTINHIRLSSIQNFPLSSLTPSVNLLRLDIYNLTYFDPLDDGSPEIVVEIMPRIREFYTSKSTLPTTKLLHAKRPYGRPAFNFMDLRQVSMCFDWYAEERNIRYLLQNAKLLEKLCLLVARDKSLVGLLSLSARTLKVLDLSVSLWNNSVFLGGICEELEAMVGHNMLEALSLDVRGVVDDDHTEDFVGSVIQKVEEVLVKPGWSMLRQVSFVLSLSHVCPESCEALQSLPGKYLSRLSKLESVTFSHSTSLCVR